VVFPKIHAVESGILKTGSTRDKIRQL
jgi:hypothetical protein